MSTTQQAKRRRRQAKLDKRYKPQFPPANINKPLAKKSK